MATYTIPQDEILIQVKAGMEVVDMAGCKVGTVMYVQFSDESPTEPSGGGESEEDTNEMPLASDLECTSFNSIRADQLEMRLLGSGYIRINGGKLSRDRYATPDQIATVTRERVSLTILQGELISP